MIQNYNEFIQKLRSPELADIVQATKHFVNSVHNLVSNPTDNIDDNTNATFNPEEFKKDVIALAMGKPHNKDMFQNMAKSIHSYIDNRITNAKSKSNVTKETTDNDEDNTSPNDILNAKKKAILLQIAKSIRIYLDTAMETMKKNHSNLWIKKNEDEDQDTVDNSSTWVPVQMAFETFLYSKCHESIWNILLPPEESSKQWKESQKFTAMKENPDPNYHIQEIMTQLQFVNAQHLEIQCILKCDAYLNSITTDENDQQVVNFNLREIFSAPIKLLQSLPAWYSPSDKLWCIHRTYKQIITTLANLSNTSSSSSTEKSATSQPSADDVLPAFIYTLIQAQPEQIVLNLAFVELMAEEEQLRGEAGYAFTNLYGAVQFLLDLNMDIENENNTETNSDGVEESSTSSGRMSTLPFAIEAEEWKAHLMKYKKNKMAKVIASLKKDSIEHEKNKDDSEDDADGEESSEKTNEDDQMFPSVSEIRAARLCGEVVDLEWIKQWQIQQQNDFVTLTKTMSGGESTFQQSPSQNNDKVKKPSKSSNASAFHSLPMGFTRSYTFLGKKPQDIRIGDIPQLLAEYHQLVNVCETMVSERNAIQKESQKLRIQKKRSKLRSDAAAAEVSSFVDSL